MATCSQCGNQALFQYQFGYLCVDCNYKFQQSQDLVTQRNERMMNYLKDMVDETFGLRTYDRFPERKPPVIHSGPLNMNSIKIDRSIVGTVNTGHIHQLEQNMQSVSLVNNDGAEAVRQFAEAVLRERSLDEGKKDEIIQQLNFLTQQLGLNDAERNKAVIKTIIASVSGVVNTTASLATLWPLVKIYFGF